MRVLDSKSTQNRREDEEEIGNRESAKGKQGKRVNSRKIKNPIHFQASRWAPGLINLVAARRNIPAG